MTKRGKTPSLISGSSGNPSVAEAKRKRTCKRCDCDIEKGEQHFEIPKLGSGFSNKKPYCISCFNEILNQTQKDLDKLQSICSQF